MEPLLSDASPSNRPASASQSKSFLRMLLDGTIKVRYWGVGFIWAWIYCAFETPALFPARDGISINADSSWVVSSLTALITIVVGGVLLHHMRRRNPVILPGAAAILGALGTALSAVAAMLPQGQVLSVVSGVLTGFGTGMLIVLWFEVLCKLNIEEGEYAVCLSAAVTLACTLVFPYLSGVIGIFAVSSLPVLSGILLIATHLQQPESPQAKIPTRGLAAGRSRNSHIAAFIRIALVIGIAYVVICCTVPFVEPAETMQEILGFDLPAGLGALLGIAMMVAFIRFSSHTDFAALFRWLSPMVILMLALFPWENMVSNFLAETLVSLLDTVLQAMSFLCGIVLVKQGAVRPGVAAGFIQGAVQLGALLGNLVGGVGYDAVCAGELSIVGFSLILIVVFSVSTTMLPQGKLNPDLAAAPLQAAAKASAAASPSADENEVSGTLVETCARLSAEYGLSAREAEVLLYLAQGRSLPYIRDLLVLSQNTVASHAKHIYAKLDVHSKQELIDLVAGK